MSAESLAGQMRTAARALLAGLDDTQRELAARPFGDDAARRWLEYRPRSRPGACLAGLSGPARKAARAAISAATCSPRITLGRIPDRPGQVVQDTVLPPRNG